MRRRWGLILLVLAVLAAAIQVSGLHFSDDQRIGVFALGAVGAILLGIPSRRIVGAALAGVAGVCVLLLLGRPGPGERLAVYRLRDDELLFSLPLDTVVCRRGANRYQAPYVAVAAASGTVPTYCALDRLRAYDGPTVRFHRLEVFTPTSAPMVAVQPPYSSRSPPTPLEIVTLFRGSVLRCATTLQLAGRCMSGPPRVERSSTARTERRTLT